MNIGFQGVHGAYSELTAKKFFKESISTLIGLKTFDDIFIGVENGSLEYGMIPIENSLAGSIHKNIDLLQSHNLKIGGEIYLKIEHNLLAVRGAKIENIEEVYSHWQALAQCEDSIKKTLPNASVREYFDTAGAAEYIAKENNENKACIASALASDVYGLEILKSNFEDNGNNYTRFVVVQKSYSNLDTTSASTFKTSITFSGNSVPGFLYTILKSFAERNINLTKIESRPIPEQTWNYFFYIDFEGRYDSEDCKITLEEIRTMVPDLKVLGSYPALSQ